MINNYATSISNNDVFNAIQDHEFFNHCRYVSSIMRPIKEMINQLESRYATIADFYIILIRIASAINRLSNTNSFKPQAIKIYNLRFKEFSTPLYQLAYYLHPLYRGNNIVIIKLSYIIYANTNIFYLRHWIKTWSIS